jgi:hypothetical protein
MTGLHRIFVVVLLPLVCAYGQMTILSWAADPEVRTRTGAATIVHYEKMRITARSTIRVLATLALQNTDGGTTARLNDAINNHQDIVDRANWCILALRDKTTAAVTCAFPLRLGDETTSQSACQSYKFPCSLALFRTHRISETYRIFMI